MAVAIMRRISNEEMELVIVEKELEIGDWRFAFDCALSCEDCTLWALLSDTCASATAFSFSSWERCMP